MSDEDSTPPPGFDLADEFGADLAAEPADERVYRIALQLHDPARVASVAERADCAPDTARRHLERLAEIGVVERVADDPATYRRNESYFEWRKRHRLEGLSDAELRARLADLAEREREFRDRYDAAGPGDVDALDVADYDEIEDVWLDLSEWETVRRRIRRIEAVRQTRADDSNSESRSEVA
ncbi:MAG: putative transcriptional regulator [Halobacteriales archaeon]